MTTAAIIKISPCWIFLSGYLPTTIISSALGNNRINGNKDMQNKTFCWMLGKLEVSNILFMSGCCNPSD